MAHGRKGGRKKQPGRPKSPIRKLPVRSGTGGMKPRSPLKKRPAINRSQMRQFEELDKPRGSR